MDTTHEKSVGDAMGVSVTHGHGPTLGPSALTLNALPSSPIEASAPRLPRTFFAWCQPLPEKEKRGRAWKSTVAIRIKSKEHSGWCAIKICVRVHLSSFFLITQQRLSIGRCRSRAARLSRGPCASPPPPAKPDLRFHFRGLSMSAGAPSAGVTVVESKPSAGQKFDDFLTHRSAFGYSTCFWLATLLVTLIIVGLVFWIIRSVRKP